MTLRDYCIAVSKEAKFNQEVLADILINTLESDMDDHQEFVWALMKEARMPFYSRQAFIAAARVAMEIADPTAPRAA